ncbi:MAG: hypothetical protein GC190_04545 [Alphaproteobacteria bacterium]|nr:hypothetical protein [Alphaproteobacteria bacterium]
MEFKASFENPKPLPPASAWIIGGICLILGLFVAAAALGWIPVSARSFNAPREVVLCAGLIFAIAGVGIIGNQHMPRALGGLLTIAIWAAFAAIASWVALGAGPRQFGGDGMWLLSALGLDFQSVGRTMFGLGALFMWLCTAAMVYAWAATVTPVTRIAAAAAVVAFAVWLFWGRGAEPAALPGETEVTRLERYIDAKHADPDFAAGDENPFLQSRAESWIKSARARLAAARTAPAGAHIVGIPQSAVAPTIDGRIDPNEWRDALRIPLMPLARGATALLLVHGGKLYVAAEAPHDRTDAGFDQLRFYFHVDLSPNFENERVFVSRGRDVLALRSVRTAKLRYGASEWRVLSRIEGESAMAPDRQFELAIDLAEAGLDSGAPFPFFIEVEGDPLRDAAGKFKARVLEGTYGSQHAPIWARIAAR